MNFKTNKLILFCNRRITGQIARNWRDSEYVKSLLNTVIVQSENSELSEVDFKLLINYIIYSLGNYYKGNTIFVFQLLVAFLYLITPVDLINDFIPAIGYLDDLLLLKLILDTYAGELAAFNKTSREMLDIKYMSVNQKVIDDFVINPTEAVDLIIKDKKLEEIHGEEIINKMIAEKESADIDDLLNIDVIEIVKYELTNYLLKSKTGNEYVDEELILSLIQIPNIVSKKNMSYFIKNINDILDQSIFEIKREKKGIFSTNGMTICFDLDRLFVNSQFNFIQVDSEYTEKREQTVRYTSSLKTKLDYEQIVELIDLSTQKHLFENTVLYFDIHLGEELITIKVDKASKKVNYVCSVKVANVLAAQLEILTKIIKERVM